MIEVICPCGRVFTLPDHVAGRSGKCKNCGARLVIPGRVEAVGDPRAIPPADTELPFPPVTQENIPSVTAFVVAEPIATESADKPKQDHKPGKSRKRLPLMAVGGLVIVACMAGAIAFFRSATPNYSTA
jgi:hypothetical protein